MKAIGPSFADELKAAGLMGLPFSWGTDGVIQFADRMTKAQVDAVNAIYAAHNPLTQAAPSAPTLADKLVAKGILTAADIAGLK